MQQRLSYRSSSGFFCQPTAINSTLFSLQVSNFIRFSTFSKAFLASYAGSFFSSKYCLEQFATNSPAWQPLQAIPLLPLPRRVGAWLEPRRMVGSVIAGTGCSLVVRIDGLGTDGDGDSDALGKVRE